MKAETFLGLSLIVKPLALLEQLSVTLQAEKMDFDSVEESVKKVGELLKKYRESEFQKSIDIAVKLPEEISDVTIRPLKEPRQKKIPARLGGGCRTATTGFEQHYRKEYYQFLDRISVEIKERFSTNGSDSDLSSYKKLAGIFKTGEIPAIVKNYPELDNIKLSYQVKDFREKTGAASVFEARKAYQAMPPLERVLHPQVFNLLKILLVCPVSSSACERSFSTLRRLKTWLRNRLSQERLNSNIVCTIHKELLMSVDVNDILNNFININPMRRRKFGVVKI